nr:rRNA biogenesis protein RRP5 [Tanacetum cinerariifolium]
MVLKKKEKDKPENLSRLANDDLGSLFADGNGGKLHRFANKTTFK